MSIRAYQGIMPQIDDSCYIDPDAVIIGQVVIGANSSVWPMVVIRGDVNHISIGENTNVQDGAILHCTHDGPYTPGGYSLEIGDQVTVGHQVMLHGAKINSGCLIGMGATVMDGVEIGSNSIIGAGSLVPPGKCLEPGFLWVGSPAKRVRKLTSDEIENISYSAQHYCRLANSYK